MRAVREAKQPSKADGSRPVSDRRVLALLAGLTEPAVLATVISTRGSTPRKTGAAMLVGRRGVIAGTIGGGCGEGEVLAAAQELFAGAPPAVVRVDLTDDFTSWSPAVCGGVMNVCIEPANPERFPFPSPSEDTP